MLIIRYWKQLSALRRLMIQDVIKLIISCIIKGICCCGRQERIGGSRSNKSELWPLQLRQALCLTQVLNHSSHQPALSWMAQMGTTVTVKPCNGTDLFLLVGVQLWLPLSTSQVRKKGLLKKGESMRSFGCVPFLGSTNILFWRAGCHIHARDQIQPQRTPSPDSLYY